MAGFNYEAATREGCVSSPKVTGMAFEQEYLINALKCLRHFHINHPIPSSEWPSQVGSITLISQIRILILGEIKKRVLMLEAGLCPQPMPSKEVLLSGPAACGSTWLQKEWIHVACICRAQGGLP